MNVNVLLMDMARSGCGLIFIASSLLDIKTRPQIFALMAQKNVPMPWLFFVGGISWKALTGLGLLINFQPVFAALLLAVYIIIANVIFNNFWALPKEKRDFPMCLFLMYLSCCCGLLAIAAGSS